MVNFASIRAKKAKNQSTGTYAFALLVSLLVCACGVELGEPFDDSVERGKANEGGYLFGGRTGVSLATLGQNAPGGPGGIGVNAFLWRATLDTLSFIPLASADPFGGVIISDWYAPPTSGGNERFKVNVLILDQRLRADAVKVSVFKQQKMDENWLDTAMNPTTASEIEDAILTRAREMWLDSTADQP